MRFLRRSGFLVFVAFILSFELGCGDQYRPVANPVLGPGGQPQSTHYAYVLNFNAAGNGSTSQMDVSGDTLTQVQSQGPGSVFEALLPPNNVRLFVANSAGDSVSTFTPTLGNALTTINLLSGSHPVALAATQSATMYVLNQGPNSMCLNSGSVSAINISTSAVTATTCVGVNPTQLVQAANGGQLYIINQGDNSISVISPNGLVAGTPITGLDLNLVYLVASSDGNYIFAIARGDGKTPGALDIISTFSSTQAARMPLGVSPDFATLDPNLNRLYVTNAGDGTVDVLDTSNVNVTASPPIPSLANPPVSIGTGSGPVGVTPLANGKLFYVANAGNNTVSVVSATSFQVLMTIALPAGSNPVWIASDPTSTKVFVANQGTSSTAIIQTVNNAIASSVASPAQDPNCTSSCALQQPMMILTQ